MNQKFGCSSAFFIYFLIGGTCTRVENDTLFANRCLLLENETSSCNLVTEQELETISKTLVQKKFPVGSKWISQIFFEAEATFRMAEQASDLCKKDFNLYQSHLRNQSIWAVRMLESSQWPRVGIFAGITYHLGNYDECLMVTSHTFQGQYCLAEGTYYFSNAESNHDLLQPVEWPTENLSAWEAIKMYELNPVRWNRQKLHWALCIPSSCRSSDLQISLNNVLPPIFQKYGLNITINVDPSRCQLIKNSNYPQEYYNARTLLYIIIGLVIMASAYDLIKYTKHNVSDENSITMEVIKGFSIVDNYQKLMNFTRENEDLAIHLMKVLAMLFVIYGHRFMFSMSFPMFDTERIEIGYKKLKCINLVHLSLVDVFICYSGFLMYHLNYAKIKSKGISQVFLSILNRWLRLMPTFGVMMIFISYILPYSNNGPLWNGVVKEAEYCRSNWIVGLLAMNNIFKTDRLCFWVSWFVSVDFQLTVIGSILLFIMVRNEKLGLYVSGLTFFVFSMVIFTVVYQNKYSGLFPMYLGALAHMRNSKEFVDVYVTLSSRVGPYLMGFLSAVVVQTLKQRKYVFSKMHIIYGSMLSILIGEYSNVYGSVFYEYGRQYGRLENAIYSAIHRSLFMFPFAYIHCMYVVSGLGFVDKFAEPWIFVPMSRLSYSVFLVNTIIQMFHTFSQRTVMPTSLTLNQFWWFTTDIVYSYVAGFLLHLFIEAPFGNIAKIIIRHLSKQLDKLRMENPKTDNRKIETVQSRKEL